MRSLISNGLRKLVKPTVSYKSGTKNAITISVATVKGGVGKTTTAVNLAAGLANQLGSKVLLIDLDAQSHCTTSLGATLANDAPVRNISDVLLGDEPFQMLDAIVESGVDNLSVTAPDPTLAEAEGRISQKIGKEFLLRDALDITKTHFDYIVIDCPPNKGNLTLNALLASDHVLVPTDLSPLSIQGADELMTTVQTVNHRLNHDVSVLGVLITRVDARNSAINEAVVEQVEEAWGDLLFDTQISVNTAFAKSQLAGQTIFDFDSRTRGAKQYVSFTKEVAKATKKTNGTSKKKSSHARRKPSRNR